MTRKQASPEHLRYQVPILSTRYARRFARFMESRGIGPRALLSGTGIDEAALNNPDAFLTMEDILAILRQAQSLLDDERAPFQFGQQLDFPAHGLLGYALARRQSQSNLARMIVQHLRVSLPVMDMTFGTTAQYCAIQLRDTWNLAEVRAFVVKIYMGSIYSLACQVGRQIRFECDFPTQLTPECWHQVAPLAELCFGSHLNQALMPLTDSLPSERDLDPRYALARQRSRQLIQPANARETVARARQAVSEHPGHGCTLEQVARSLNMSSRSLHNRLADADTTFRDIRNEIRETYATRYLTETELALGSIAKKVGFSDQAAFTRAYRNWTGRTPGEVRRQAESATH